MTWSKTVAVGERRKCTKEHERRAFVGTVDECVDFLQPQSTCIKETSRNCRTVLSAREVFRFFAIHRFLYPFRDLFRDLAPALAFTTKPDNVIMSWLRISVMGK